MFPQIFLKSLIFLFYYLQIADAGGSIFVHVFGAYFGLAISYVMAKTQQGNDDKQETGAESLKGSNYTSDIFAMIGETLSLVSHIHRNFLIGFIIYVTRNLILKINLILLFRCDRCQKETSGFIIM